MAQLNAKTPMNPAPERDTAQPARSSSVLPLAAVLAALVIGAGAYVYYQGERDAGTGTNALQSTTSDTSASVPAGTTAVSTESAPSSMQSATTMPKASAGASASAAPSASSAKPHRVAKASKPVKELVPRERQVVLTTHPNPVYPLQALRAGEQGTVTVLAQVDVDGQVTDARVIRHSGSIVLDRAAPSEVRHWKFEPALHDGHPVVARVEVPVSYRLNQ